MSSHWITTVDELQAIYGTPGETSLVKETDHVTRITGR